MITRSDDARTIWENPRYHDRRLENMSSNLERTPPVSRAEIGENSRPLYKPRMLNGKNKEKESESERKRESAIRSL